MPRYLVERGFADGLHIPIGEEGAVACREVVDKNADRSRLGRDSLSTKRTHRCRKVGSGAFAHGASDAPRGSIHFSWDRGGLQRCVGSGGHGTHRTRRRHLFGTCRG